MKKLIWAIALIIVLIIGTSNATMLAKNQGVALKEVTFQNHYQFDHNFQFFCTQCRQYTDVSEMDIAEANAMMSATRDLALISCSHCGKVYYMPQDQTLTGDPEDSWLECIPYTGIGAVEPLGGGLELPPGSGQIYYSAGGSGPGYGSDGLLRSDYELTYGYDPVVMWQHMSAVMS
jgi:hypothetical protein